MIPKASDYELLDAAQITQASDEDQIWEAYARELEDHDKHKRQTERAAELELDAIEGVKP